MAFRTDIQALRGYAVLLVVLQHAKLGPIGAGYLGVDIFFVISGFLITGMVSQGIQHGDFIFSKFYFRRAKRLLPAAYVTFAITSLLAPIFLGAVELKEYAKQVVGAITFTCNIVLWRQSGYFDSASDLKPLLHVWSLSIEEQYYLFLPAALVYVPKRFWLLGTSLLLIASLALCLVLEPLKPTAVFYLLPARAWEFALGSLAALTPMESTRRLQYAMSFLFWPCVVALLVIPVMPIANFHPGPDAVIVCISTAVIILRRHKVFNEYSGPRMLAKVGDFSYSLYLVHWPIIAFINNAFIDQPSISVYVVAVVLAVILGYFLYRFVELPVRRTEIKLSRKLVIATVASSLALAITPFGISLANTPNVDYSQVRRINAGFGLACEFEQNFTPKMECRNSDNPVIAVWGDSYAMHLIPGIIATTNVGVVQATRSVCGPLIGLAPIDNTIYTRTWAEQCLAFNQSVINYLAATPSIKVVVMSSRFSQYLDPSDAGRLWHSLVVIEGKQIEQVSSKAGVVEAMQKSIEQLRALGKRVVIVAPPPASGFDYGRCLERKATGLFTFSNDNGCNIPIEEYHKYRGPVIDYLKLVHDKSEVPIVNFDKILCSEYECATSLSGTFVYRDQGHFSYDGSQMVARRIGLGNLLQTVAR